MYATSFVVVSTHTYTQDPWGITSPNSTLKVRCSIMVSR